MQLGFRDSELFEKKKKHTAKHTHTHHQWTTRENYCSKKKKKESCVTDF